MRQRDFHFLFCLFLEMRQRDFHFLFFLFFKSCIFFDVGAIHTTLLRSYLFRIDWSKLNIKQIQDRRRSRYIRIYLLSEKKYYIFHFLQSGSDIFLIYELFFSHVLFCFALIYQNLFACSESDIQLCILWYFILGIFMSVLFPMGYPKSKLSNPKWNLSDPKTFKSEIFLFWCIFSNIKSFLVIRTIFFISFDSSASQCFNIEAYHRRNETSVIEYLKHYKWNQMKSNQMKYNLFYFISNIGAIDISQLLFILSRTNFWLVHFSIVLSCLAMGGAILIWAIWNSKFRLHGFAIVHLISFHCMWRYETLHYIYI